MTQVCAWPCRPDMWHSVTV